MLAKISLHVELAHYFAAVRRLATRIPTVRFAAVVLSPTARIIHPADGNECAVTRLVATTKRDPSRPAGCSESVAGTRSFSRREGHFHEALNPQHARPDDVPRRIGRPDAHALARYIAENRVSLHRPRRILRSYLRSGEKHHRYTANDSCTLRADCQFLNTHKTRSIADATTK